VLLVSDSGTYLESSQWDMACKSVNNFKDGKIQKDRYTILLGHLEVCHVGKHSKDCL
jgi:hypothetical protein